MSRFPLLSLVLVSLILGCGSGPRNQSFHLSVADADKALDAMQAEPRPLERPVVVVDGFLDPGVGSMIVAHRVRKLTPHADQVIRVNLLSCADFDSCRRKIIEAVDAAFPTDDPNQTREVDVIGISMGGVAARYAALPTSPPSPATRPASPNAASPDAEPLDAEPLMRSGRRLRIARLFTLASPHLGARRADQIPALLPTHRDMQTTSAFLKNLNDPRHQPEYTIVPYVRLADTTIGPANAAPLGQTPIWLPKGPLDAAHAGVVVDPRIAADVCRRLRSEASFVSEPRTPLPD